MSLGVIFNPGGITWDDTYSPWTYIPENTTDYSKLDITPYAKLEGGALYPFETVAIRNNVREKTYGLFKYTSFCRYFIVRRTDYRVIYDDDGIIDTSTSKTSLKEDIINYPCQISFVQTKLPNDAGGFLWTTRQAKFGSGICGPIYYNGTKEIGDDGITIATDPTDTVVTAFNFKDTFYTSSNIGGGGGVVTLSTLSSSTLIGQKEVNPTSFAIYFKGTGYWKNLTWGDTGDNISITENATGYIACAKRDWNNSISLVNKNLIALSWRDGYAVYSPKQFTIVASNLNNYLKINSSRVYPYYGTDVVPYRDGHHITISEVGVTLLEVEHGAENKYEKVYCFIDDVLPDIEFVYSNPNAQDNRKVGMITTNTSGAKEQTIHQGVFKDQVQINYSYNSETESPERATYTLNGQTYDLPSGSWLSEEGDYVVTLTDYAGNKTISKFTVDKSSPSYNLERLTNDTTYKVGKWCVASIPSGYSNYGTYSFANFDLALNFVKESEFENCVTTYTLNDVNDFIYYNLLANGEVIAKGEYWYYKSRDNPNLYVYYFSKENLDAVIDYYARDYISEEQTYKINATLIPNNYGNTLHESMYSNIIEVNGISAYLINNFNFRYLNDNETYKIYYCLEGTENWVEFSYDKKLSQQVNSNGLYKIKEIDYVGHETTYYVYLDLYAPILEVEAKLYGKDKIINHTISINDIPKNNTLIYYYETFTIKNIIESDKWWAIEVKKINDKTYRYTYQDGFPDFENLGAGEYQITIADRLDNQFQFTLCLLGKAPEVSFQTINANTQLKILISSGESYNTLTKLKIYRNNICLNSDNGYDEYPTDDTNELIYISVHNLQYIFNKGGNYAVEITDNFGRTLTYDYKFEKDLPTGYLIGVEHNGKTKNDVQFKYDSNKYFVVLNKNNESYESEFTQDKNITILKFNAEENAENYFTIELVEKLDTENYNQYNFTQKTIKPIINLFGVSENGTTGGSVYAMWDEGQENWTATYTLNEQTYEYRKGQVIDKNGEYTISLTDELGNTNQVKFNIDKSIKFLIKDIYENTYKIEDIEFINFDIKLISDEPLEVYVKRNSIDYDYSLGLFISEEGYYTVNLIDQFGNTCYFYFTIDKTKPQATLYGVDNFGTTKNSAWVSSIESNLTSYYVKNKTDKFDYKLGKEISGSGHYKVCVLDRAKNITEFEFNIDNEVSFDVNTYLGGISNGGVRIVGYENLPIVIYKNENIIEYSFGEQINEDGNYTFILTDDYGNKVNFFFSIINKKQKSLNHILQNGISVTSVMKGNESYDFKILDNNNLYLYDEGTYKVNIFDSTKNEEFSFEITIDTTPPTLEIIGVENNGKTKNIVILKNVSEQPYSLLVFVDGVKFNYTLGEEIEKCGVFKVVLKDEAGNTTIYNFERIYALNGPSIAIIAGLGALVVLLIIFLVKTRKSYYKEDEEITETEEYDVLIENKDSEDEENSENEG